MRLFAASQAPAARDWLASTNHARVSGSFERAFNLINVQGKLLSVVAQEIGNGPFAMVIADFQGSFGQIADDGATVSVLGKQMLIDTLVIDFTEADLWHPRPDWEGLAVRPDRILAGLTKLQAVLRLAAPAGSMVTLLETTWQSTSHNLATAVEAVKQFYGGLSKSDVCQVKSAARSLAGLGSGLTPAGDDFLMGALHALWAINGTDKAVELSETIVGVAAPRTTQVSAAWLWAAARGEASERWHKLISALVSGKAKAISPAARCILATGHTSGADALTGFVMSAYALHNQNTQ